MAIYLYLSARMHSHVILRLHKVAIVSHFNSYEHSINKRNRLFALRLREAKYVESMSDHKGEEFSRLE